MFSKEMERRMETVFKMKNSCLNCCNLQTTPNPERTDLTHTKRDGTELTTSLNKVFRWTLKANPNKTLKTQSDLEICTNCNSIFALLCKHRNDFLSKTYENSIIAKLVENVEEKKNDEAIGEVLGLTNENDCDVNDKVILTNENLLDDEIKIQSLSVKHEDLPELTLKLELQKCVSQSEKTPNSVSGDASEVHFCDHCSRQFKSQKLLQSHLVSAHGKASISCHFCNKKFVHNWFFKNHIKSAHHGIEIAFSCLLCKKQCSSQKDLDEHRFSSHGMTSHPFKCNYCDVAYKTVKEIELLRVHLIEKHNDTKEAAAAEFNAKMILKNCRKKKNSQCCLCDKVFSNSKFRNIHVLFDHQERRSCLTCLEEFSTETEFYQHVVDTKHEQKECHSCSKQFADSLKLICHWNSVHLKTGELPCVCEMCGFGFRDLHLLKEHYVWHSRVAGPRMFPCNQCDKSFAMKHHLELHLSHVHSANTTKVACTLCKKLFKPTFLKRHMAQTHADKKSYKFKCSECGVSCRTSAGLVQHERIHTEPGFTTKFLNHKATPMSMAALKRVAYINVDGETKFQCSECKNIFSRRDHLYIHLRKFHMVASNEKNRTEIYWKEEKIQVKNNTYKRRCNIPFKCTLCDHTCTGIIHIRTHFLDHHENSNEAKAAANNLKRIDKDLQHAKQQLKRESHDFAKNENVCSTCKTTFLTIAEKECHEYVVHKRGRVCKVCGKTCDTEISLKKHLSSDHVNFPCKLCAPVVVLSSVDDFFAHLEDMHTQRLFTCEFCGTHFPFEKDIRHHYRYFHSHSPSLGFSCHICGESFSTAYLTRLHRLKNHSQTVTKSMKHQCKICNSKLKEKAGLYDHLTKVHKMLGSFKCKDCGGHFHTEIGLRNHRSQIHVKSAITGSDTKKKPTTLRKIKNIDVLRVNS